jgi:hypothetical protein
MATRVILIPGDWIQPSITVEAIRGSQACHLTPRPRPERPRSNRVKPKSIHSSASRSSSEISTTAQSSVVRHSLQRDSWIPHKLYTGCTLSCTEPTPKPKGPWASFLRVTQPLLEKSSFPDDTPAIKPSASLPSETSKTSAKHSPALPTRAASKCATSQASARTSNPTSTRNTPS